MNQITTRSDYDALPAVNFSALSVFARSPLDFQRMQSGAKRTPTQAMELGTLLHGLVLEGDVAYYVRPDTYGEENKPWSGNAKECKAWMAAHADKPVLTSAESRDLINTMGYIKAHPKAGPLLAGCRAEVTLTGTDTNTGLPLKGRLDAIRHGTDYTEIIDLKRMREADTREMGRTIFYRNYHVQAAMYRRLALLNGAPAVRYYFIAVEDGDFGPKVNVRELNPRALDRGDEVLDEWLALYAQARAANNWPEWRDDSPGISAVDLPEFAYPEPELTGLTAA